MRRSALLGCLLAAVLGASGCSGGSSPAARPTVTVTAAPSSATASPSSASAAPAEPAVRRDDSQEGAAFSTPSGNITCWLDTGREFQGSNQVVGCSIDAKSWTAPPNPTCQVDYGNILSVGGGGAPQFECRGDIPSCFGPEIGQPNECDGPSGLWWRRTGDPTFGSGASAEAVLPYGVALRIGSMQCTSRTSGVTCSDLDTGHGFTISRERYTLTPQP